MKTLKILCGISLVVAACSGDDASEGPDGGDVVVELLSVSGSLVDFESGDALTTGTVSVDGIAVPPVVTVTGGEFEIAGIPPFSNFHLLAGNAPSHRSTYGSLIVTTDVDLDALVVPTLSEDFVAQLHSVFEVTESSTTSVVVGKLVDEAGAVASGVPATAFGLEAGMEGPFFLDDERIPDATLTESSSSGYFVVFNVTPGIVSFVAAEDAGVTLVMADSPVAARAVTLAEVLVQDGEIVVPTDVSFSQDIVPIFDNRGCVLCHSGSGVGKDLGGLHLNGEANKMYKELAEEVSENHGVIRIDLETPENSLMLTLPSKEDPPDVHPNSTFQSAADPDYLLMLGWIREGALNN